MSKSLLFGRLLRRSFLTTAVAGGSYIAYESLRPYENDSKLASKLPEIIKKFPSLPSRQEMILRLGAEFDSEKPAAGVEDIKEKFDVVIIGGGATGTGSAVDAATRGLNVLLVERNDFASGTSSKSTKMAHGGVRYLEKAFWELSKAQLDLVIEALNERSSMLSNAPHLSSILPILIPVYKLWQLPYMYIGCVMYDLFAGRQNLRRSYVLTPNGTTAAAPTLDPTGLVGSIVYHDGSFNDARMNVTLALTAVKNGATVLNYLEVAQLVKSEDGKVKGVRITDKETGKQYVVGAESVVNATGPFADTILDMDHDPKGLPPKTPLTTPRMVVPSGGVHIMLPDFYCPKDLGLLDPSTPDGRVMFFLPWQGRVLAGTTDTPLKKVPTSPIPSEDEILDILKEIQHYVKFEVKREDVLSAWCGVRPLVRDPKKVPKDGSTQGLVRNHLVHHSDSGMITISGGKWTTYREMAEDTINNVLKVTPSLSLKAKPCQTKQFKLLGGEFYDETLTARLAQEYRIPTALSEYLAKNYGDRAATILELYKADEQNRLPVSLAASDVKPSYDAYEYPVTVAELKYCIDNEYTRHPIDFLARRTRLAMLDAKVGLESVEGVVEVMGKEFNWSGEEKAKIRSETEEFIKYMGIYENTSCYVEEQKH